MRLSTLHGTSRWHSARRGSAIVGSLTALLLVCSLGSAILALGMQSARRGRLDVLRTRALGLADAGAEKAVAYLRTVAPDGSNNGSWRTNGRTEVIDTRSDFTMIVTNGTGPNSGKVVVTSVGRVSDGELSIRRGVRLVLKISEEDISVWNNAIFGGVGQTGKSINGNVVIRGGVHLLGDGESFTDLDLDGKWDAEETFTDSNHNGTYDAGEAFVDTDGDGNRDTAEPFDDVNGNGSREPALTVTDLGSDLGGTSNIGNNYSGMSASLRSLLPNPPSATYQGETVDTLNAKLRVKHGRVNIQGSATVGDPDLTGGSPAVKEPMDGVYVSDGFVGSPGENGVYSDNGAKTQYELGDISGFPTLTSPVTKNGMYYSSYMNYLSAAGMHVAGPLTLQPGTAFSQTDGAGNLLMMDTQGNITINGIIYVNGDIRISRNGGNRDTPYSGRGTLVSTGNIYLSTNLIPAAPTFPTTQAMGFIARHRLELATQGGDSQLQLAGAFYAQEQVVSAKQNEIAGTFVSSYFSLLNVPRIYQVPLLTTNLPPGMPGSDSMIIKTVRVDSWREVNPP
jgi:hypothetical protein